MSICSVADDDGRVQRTTPASSISPARSLSTVSIWAVSIVPGNGFGSDASTWVGTQLLEYSDWLEGRLAGTSTHHSGVEHQPGTVVVDGLHGRCQAGPGVWASVGITAVARHRSVVQGGFVH